MVCGGVMLKTVVLIQADETADCHEELHTSCPVSHQNWSCLESCFLLLPSKTPLATVRIFGEHGHFA